MRSRYAMPDFQRMVSYSLPPAKLSCCNNKRSHARQADQGQPFDHAGLQAVGERGGGDGGYMATAAASAAAALRRLVALHLTLGPENLSLSAMMLYC